MKNHITLQSSNQKTGPIVVTTASNKTCPSECPFQNNGCYAGSGPLKLHWDKVSAGLRGFEWGEFINTLKSLPEETPVRINQAGDLPGEGNSIDFQQLSELTDALKGKEAWSYTHKPVLTNQRNAEAVKQANQEGFTINLSANNLVHADKLKALNIGPVCVVLPSSVEGNQKLSTPAGNRVVVCPATYSDDITCKTCKLCAWADREVIIGFPAHGTSKKKVDTAVAAECVA